jgi:hypothetical protein
MALSTKYGVVKEYGTIIGRTTIDAKASRAARKWNRAIDNELSEQRKEWILVPPSNMTITLHADAGAVPAGLTLSASHETGRSLIHKRLVNVIEHDVTIDAEIEGSYEDTFEAMNLGTKETGSF